MITAQEARARVEHSTFRMEQRMAKLESIIMEAADLGKNSVVLNCIHGEDWAIKHEPYRLSEFTPIQKLVRDQLMKLGYGMNIISQEVQIGGGLGSMDDEVRHEMRPYIKISW